MVVHHLDLAASLAAGDMDGHVGVVVSMPTVAMLLGSAAVFVCRGALLRGGWVGTVQTSTIVVFFLNVFLRSISKLRLWSVFSPEMMETHIRRHSVFLLKFAWRDLIVDLARVSFFPSLLPQHPGAVYPTRCKQAFRCSLQAPHAPTYQWGAETAQSPKLFYVMWIRHL